jgi:hypothetical protein
MESKVRDGSKLKRILRDSVFSHSRKDCKEAKDRGKSSNISNKAGESRQKTKYERILE